MSSGSTFTYAQMAKAKPAAPTKPAAPSLSPAAARQEAHRKAEAHLASFNAERAADTLLRQKWRDENAARAADKARAAALAVATGVTPAYIAALSQYYREQHENYKQGLALAYQSSQRK